MLPSDFLEKSKVISFEFFRGGREEEGQETQLFQFLQSLHYSSDSEKSLY